MGWGPFLRVLAVLALLLASCTSDPEVADTAAETTSTEAATPAAETATTAGTTTSAPTTTEAEDEALGSEQFAVPFTFQAPEGTNLTSRPAGGFPEDIADFGGGRNQFLTFTTAGEETVQAWAEKLSGTEGVSVSESFPTEVGGQPAEAVDVTVDASRVTVFSKEGEGEYYIFEGVQGDKMRIYVTEVGGEPVSIIALASQEDFEEWIGEIEPALATLEFAA